MNMEQAASRRQGTAELTAQTTQQNINNETSATINTSQLCHGLELISVDVLRPIRMPSVL